MLGLSFLVLLTGMAATQECKQPLDAQVLQQLSLGWNNLQMQPGESHQFSLAILKGYAPDERVAACATWKVEPEGKGAAISSRGELKIDPHTSPGSKFTVTADIENGRVQKTIGVLIYAQQTLPLTGLWQQQQQFDCDTGKQIVATEPIRELGFRANGSFSVTWVPFETYRDYWGTYVLDTKEHTLALTITGGNYKPPDFRGAGAFKLTAPDTVEFTNLYLGTRRNGPAPDSKPAGNKCRYIFKRTSLPH